MCRKLSILFAFAIFVLLVGWAITPAQAKPCKGPHADDDGCGGGPVAKKGKATSLIITFDDQCNDGIDNDNDGNIDADDPDCDDGSMSGNSPLFPNILSDDGPYIDKEDVKASAGGHITLSLGIGNNDRKVELDISCAEIDFNRDGIPNINNCNQLPSLGDGNFGLVGEFPGTDTVVINVNPYKFNCPNDTNECPDVFTMDNGDPPELMGFSLAMQGGGRAYRC